jgi:hypothetical protein
VLLCGVDDFFDFVSTLYFGRKLDLVLLAGGKFTVHFVAFWLDFTQRFVFIEVHLFCCVTLLIFVRRHFDFNSLDLLFAFDYEMF